MRLVTRRNALKAGSLAIPLGIYHVLGSSTTQAHTQEISVQLGSLVFVDNGHIFGISTAYAERHIAPPNEEGRTIEISENREVSHLIGGLLNVSYHSGDGDPRHQDLTQLPRAVQLASDNLLYGELESLNLNDSELYWVRFNPWFLYALGTAGAIIYTLVIKPFAKGFFEETGRQSARMWLRSEGERER